MAQRATFKVCWLAAVIFAFLVSQARVGAQTLNELIAGAKKESEIVFVAGATTFGGRQAFSDLQAAFNRRFA